MKNTQQKRNNSFRPGFSVLSRDRVELVIAEAYRILEEIGVHVEHAEAVEMLSGAGARVADGGERVYITRDLCEKCLDTIPGSFRLYNRDGERNVEVGGGGTIFDPGSSALSLYDYESGKIRAATTGDVIDFAALIAQIDVYDCQSTGLIPSDVPEDLADRFRLLISLLYCDKPVITGTFVRDGFETMHRMLCAVRGDADKLREKPLAIFDCCPTAPLSWSELTCDALVSCARTGVPAEIVSMPLTGATSPVTLSGAVVQHAAETLSGLVIHQLAGTGAPVVYGGAPAFFDMRKATTPMGAVETMLIDTAYCDVGRHLGLPRHAYMGLSDAKSIDFQAGFETAMGIVLASLAGINVVSGPGMLNFVGTQSLEKLLLDAEICEMGRRLIRGVEFHGGDEAIEELREHAADKSFLKSEHTRQYFRNEGYYPSGLIDRGSDGEWDSAGRPTSSRLAHDRVAELLSNRDSVLTDSGVVSALESIMDNSARAHGVNSLPDWKSGLL
jgi:trimethylamine--corrinoid protein Co-methyltransferase